MTHASQPDVSAEPVAHVSCEQPGLPLPVLLPVLALVLVTAVVELVLPVVAALLEVPLLVVGPSGVDDETRSTWTCAPS